MHIQHNRILAPIATAIAIGLCTLVGCGHSHHDTKNTTMSPIAKTVDSSGFKEEKKVEKHGD